MYCIISSSPIISSSSMELGTGDGADKDCRLEEAEGKWPVLCPVLIPGSPSRSRVAASDTFGLKSFRPFEGDSAENLCLCDSWLGAVEEKDATEPVEDLRRPEKESESRVDLRAAPLTVAEPCGADTCRGTRVEEDCEGEARTDSRFTAEGFVAVPSPLPLPSITPNSLGVPLGVGDGSFDGAATLTFKLVLRAGGGIELFIVGELVVDVRLEMRGIFVGVSLGSPEMELLRVDGGNSLGSLEG